MNRNGLANVGTPLYSITLPRDLDCGSSKASDIVFTGAQGTPCSSLSNSALVNSPIVSWTILSTSSLFCILTLFSFQDVGNLIAEKYKVPIEYIPFPEHLEGKYQEFTKAKNEAWPVNFRTVKSYVKNGME